MLSSTYGNMLVQSGRSCEPVLLQRIGWADMPARAHEGLVVHAVQLGGEVAQQEVDASHQARQLVRLVQREPKLLRQ